MTSSAKLIEEGRKDELWQKHCGYIGLSMKDFMEIQKRLMMEQIKYLGPSRIGKHFMGDKTPATIEEFRKVTPLTRYPDYEPFLSEQKEDDLPAKPYVWARSSGRTSDHGPKWFPYSREIYDKLSDAVVGAMLMSSCNYPGDVKLERHEKFLMATAPRPYTSGFLANSAYENLDVVFLPSLEEGESMSYGGRVAAGFKLAMKEGLDYFMGLSLVLARMGEQFETQSNTSKPSKDLMNPFTLFRLLKAVLIARFNNRNILPKDIWKLKGIMSGGTDTGIYMEKIEYYWGRKPLEGFACTEGGNLAMQSWNYKGMTFFPDSVFLEFIPLEEVTRNKADPSYQPATVLYDELQLGVYELVLSNFMGGVLMRYRMNDLFEVTSIGDPEIKSILPQVRFYSRTDDIIDIGNFFRLTERDVWETVEDSKLPYVDWSATKEVVNGDPRIHLYIELKGSQEKTDEEIHALLDECFCERFGDYREFKENIGLDPLIFTRLPQGSFDAYTKAKLAVGADLAHLKPPHMRPTAETLKSLLSVAGTQ